MAVDIRQFDRPPALRAVLSKEWPYDGENGRVMEGGSHGDRVLDARFPGPSETKIPPLLDLLGRVGVADTIEEHHPMPTKDGFDPAHPLPPFLADQAEQRIGNALDGAAPKRRISTSRIFQASILIAAATAIGIAVAAGDPVALLAWGSASLVGNSSSQSTPTIQSAADAPALIASTTDAQVLPPTTKDASTRDEIAASEPAGQDQTENSELRSETLFRQFQAWAAEQEAQAQKAQAGGGPVQPAAPAQVVQAPAKAVQNAPAQNVAENVRAPNRLVQKRRQVRSVHNARAEMRTQNLRKQVRRAERARAERPPVQAERPPLQDARAQDTSVQNAQGQQFLPTFGERN